MRANLENLPASYITESTISRMHSLVKRGKTDPNFIHLISDAIRKSGCAPKDYLCECNFLFNLWHYWTSPKTGIRYLRDPHQVELVQDIWAILKRKSGDCDCLSILYAASVGCIGLEYQFVTVKADPEEPTRWSHIYVEVHIPGHEWVPADLSMQEANLGWEPETYFAKKVWEEPVY